MARRPSVWQRRLHTRRAIDVGYVNASPRAGDETALRRTVSRRMSSSRLFRVTRWGDEAAVFAFQKLSKGDRGAILEKRADDLHADR